MSKFYTIINAFVLLTLSFFLEACSSFSHTCTEACNPICLVYANEQARISQEDWQEFKNYKAFHYRPIGRPLIDESMIMYAKITNQLYREVIIPYIQQDMDGSLAVYRAFKNQVEYEMEQKNLSRKQATEFLISIIKQEKPDDYRKILYSFRIAENRNFSAQITKILAKITPNLLRLISVLSIKNQRFDEFTPVDLVYISIVLIPEINKTIKTCEFLNAIRTDNNKSDVQIRKFVEEHENFGKTSTLN